MKYIHNKVYTVPHQNFCEKNPTHTPTHQIMQVNFTYMTAYEVYTRQTHTHTPHTHPHTHTLPHFSFKHKFYPLPHTPITKHAHYKCSTMTMHRKQHKTLMKTLILATLLTTHNMQFDQPQPKTNISLLIKLILRFEHNNIFFSIVHFPNNRESDFWLKFKQHETLFVQQQKCFRYPLHKYIIPILYGGTAPQNKN